jgi:hypothetical protein
MIQANALKLRVRDVAEFQLSLNKEPLVPVSVMTPFSVVPGLMRKGWVKKAFPSSSSSYYVSVTNA